MSDFVDTMPLLDGMGTVRAAIFVRIYYVLLICHKLLNDCLMV